MSLAFGSVVAIEMALSAGDYYLRTLIFRRRSDSAGKLMIYLQERTIPAAFMHAKNDAFIIDTMLVARSRYRCTTMTRSRYADYAPRVIHAAVTFFTLRFVMLLVV